MITLTCDQWTLIRKRLKEEYDWKPSVFMIRDVMRRELGFTTRYHREYNEQTGSMESICLDFYDDAAESWFRLRFL
jgi:hypothetical protein